MARALIHSSTKFAHKSEAVSSAWLRRNARACRPWRAFQFANKVCKTLLQKGRSFCDPMEAHHWTSNLAFLVFILLQPLQPSCGQSCRLNKSPVDIPVLWNSFKLVWLDINWTRLAVFCSASDFLCGDGRSSSYSGSAMICSLFDFLEYSSWSWQCPFPERCLPLTTGPASKQSVGGENDIASLYHIAMYLAQLWSFEMLNCIRATCSTHILNYIDTSSAHDSKSERVFPNRQSLSRSEGPCPRNPHSASCLLSCKLPAQSIWWAPEVRNSESDGRRCSMDAWHPLTRGHQCKITRWSSRDKWECHRNAMVLVAPLVLIIMELVCQPQRKPCQSHLPNMKYPSIRINKGSKWISKYIQY